MESEIPMLIALLREHARTYIGTLGLIGALQLTEVFASLTWPLYMRLQPALDHVNHIEREQLTGVRVLCAFVRQGYQRARFAQASRELHDLSMRAGYTGAAGAATLTLTKILQQHLIQIVSLLLTVVGIVTMIL